jgi:hypothetical protein
MTTNGKRHAWSDSMVPVQFYGGRATTPERRLMAAVLEDALGIALGPAQRNSPSVRASTEEWLFSDDEAWPFSFVNVCHALGIDPVWLRERVLAQRCTARVRSAA